MNYMKKLSDRKEYLVIGVLVVGILAIAGFICPPFYSMNDDVMMKSIMSGTYTGSPDGHAIYMKYPLTGIISLLYRITGNISWFDLMMTGCFWLSITAVLCRVMQKGNGCQDTRKKVCLIAAISLVCLALFLPHLLTMHYTLVAAMVGSCALFLVVTGGGLFWIVLLLLCYCIRSQVFFLLLPFLGVAVLWRILTEWKQTGKIISGKKLIVQLPVLAAGILICVMWNSFMYRSHDWQQYMEYNDSRTQLYDYNYLAPYQENQVAFENAGISKVQHDILDQYALVLDEEIGIEIMDNASEISLKMVKEQANWAEQWKESIKEYYYHFRYTDVSYKYLVLGGYLLVLILLLTKREILKSLLVCCMAGGRSLIWIYLIREGRFPERIYVSLYFLELMILAGMVVDILISMKKQWQLTGRRVGRVVALTAVCALCLYVGVDQWTEMYERTMGQKEIQKKWDVMVQYCEEHPDILYLLDVRSMVDYSGKVWDTGRTQENYMLSGGWMSESPLLKERLGDAKDGGELLVKWHEESCYIIGVNREAQWLQEYCQSRFGEVELEKIDSVWLNSEEIFNIMRIKADD